jgi:hypothetical protein
MQLDRENAFFVYYFTNFRRVSRLISGHPQRIGPLGGASLLYQTQGHTHSSCSQVEFLPHLNPL